MEETEKLHQLPALNTLVLSGADHYLLVKCSLCHKIFSVFDDDFFYICSVFIVFFRRFLHFWHQFLGSVHMTIAVLCDIVVFNIKMLIYNLLIFGVWTANAVVFYVRIVPSHFVA